MENILKKIGHYFFLLSLGWEILELFIPFSFAIETTKNKIADIFINIIGYKFGLLKK